jgi:hypothetical protein
MAIGMDMARSLPLPVLTSCPKKDSDTVVSLPSEITTLWEI